MNYAEFGQGIDMLKSQWPNTYGNERIKIIWEKVSYLPKDKWLSAVRNLLGTHRQAPLLSEIEEALGSVRSSEPVAKLIDNREWESEYSCSCCRDLGVYLAAHQTTGARYAFRCHCPRGSNDSRKYIPQYTSAHARDFYYYDFFAERRKQAVEEEAAEAV